MSRNIQPVAADMPYLNPSGVAMGAVFLWHYIRLIQVGNRRVEKTDNRVELHVLIRITRTAAEPPYIIEPSGQADIISESRQKACLFVNVTVSLNGKRTVAVNGIFNMSAEKRNQALRRAKYPLTRNAAIGIRFRRHGVAFLLRPSCRVFHSYLMLRSLSVARARPSASSALPASVVRFVNQSSVCCVEE